MRRLLLSVFTLLLLSNLDGWAAGEFAFSFENGFLLVKGHMTGRTEPLIFLVDSGASATVLDAAVARRLKLPLGRAVAVQGVDAEATAYYLHGVSLAVGREEVAEAELAVNLGKAAPLCGRPIDGLLGMNFFVHRIVQIDYAAGKIRLLDAAPAPARDSIRLPLARLNGVFCVPVSVNGSRPRSTRLDTGCNDSLHWVVPSTEPARRQSTTIGFIDAPRNLTRAEVLLGEWQLSRIETSLHGSPLFPGEAGQLGNGLLSHYVVTIDAPGHQLHLSR